MKWALTPIGMKAHIYIYMYVSSTMLKPTISNTTISLHPLNQEPQPISRKDVHIIIQWHKHNFVYKAKRGMRGKKYERKEEALNSNLNNGQVI